ncbi:MAG: chromosome segregation protein SMC [Gammaproteobacteria bacterium]|nr:chromosome segregation protein SMC [Gammaproteobacteria bacterium]
MRLSKIKLAGFKSFVDPTPIHFPSNLVGIVGPNGCGKSNVIDAIRWVMGETSAKHLRGDSMADVIFNGSSSRKPVGAASVELYFDNSDGTVGGQYADYNELCIKRAVSRDGTSQYFLNNVRCRRKDITGIFLGTGLGPRSYAIIEQGMISRLIEAKPDEMRVYIEEAAGISKYKERRRETENRIRHTRDNLDRLNDLREEVEKQIKHLERQKRQAERYKELKHEERTLEAELLAIRLGDLQRELEGQEQQLSQGQTLLEAAIADQRGVEAKIEQAREKQVEEQEAFNAAQGRVWSVQSDISRLEQALAHARETRDRHQEDLKAAESQLMELVSEIDADRAQLEELDTSLERLAPDLEQARAAEQLSVTALRNVESALEEWQKTWHDFTLETKEHQRVSHVEAARIEQLEARIARLQHRDAELGEERQSVSLDDLEAELLVKARTEQDASQAVDRLAGNLQRIDRELVQLREQEQSFGSELEQVRGNLESARGRVETLEALQEAALGQDQDEVRRWSAAQNLGGRPRLAQRLRVEKPWERAVETVLGDFLQAICVTRCEDHLGSLPSADIMLIDGSDERGDAAGTLLAQVENAGSAAALLGAVRTADTLDEALRIQQGLQEGQSVVTTDGVWLGRGWVRISRGQEEAVGLISREHDIRELRDQVREFEQKVVRLETDRRTTRARLGELEAARAPAHQKLTEANRYFGEAASVLASLRQDFDRMKNRMALLDRDSQAVRDELESMQQSLRDSGASLEHAATAIDRLEARRPELEAQREQLQAEFEQAREKAASDQATAARINVEFESRRASRQSASTTLTRISAQRGQLQERVNVLSESISSSDAPLQGMQDELDSALRREVGIKRELDEQRRKAEAADTELRTSEISRTECEAKVAEAREQVDGLRMHVRETQVRREGVAEQFTQLQLELEAVVANLDDAADVDQWDERLTTVKRRIDRLGAINLAAIEEFEEHSERQKYLEAQFEDLTSALETLEGAIRKIDRETRTRFKETFDNVNDGMQRLFPKLFGGGHAYLNLDGDDLLSAGVTVMARPPGKRNSTIHLLSGGEKALTAVSLVFSIFELNPAPFCLLDEVDAPLDDANVSRFCDIVREMSESVQFLCITHNKTTMEMVRQLTGVTMNEPGVSRLVSVDIDEAVKLVAT